MKVAFAGTPAFAAEALAAIHAAGFAVPLVLTQPDRPAGRGMALTASAVKQTALALNLPLAQPQGLKLDGRYAQDAIAAQAALAAAAPDVMVVAAYGLILPQWVLDLPHLGCLNIHASLLPRWRGAAPIHRAIEAGDTETGIAIMQMDAGLDTGAVIATAREPMAPTDTTGTLHDRLATLGARLVVEVLRGLGDARAASTPQPAAGVSYAHKIDKAEAAIVWQAPAAQIERRLRAFSPAPGLYFTQGGQRIKLWAAEVVPLSAPPGTLLATPTGLAVACGEGALRPLQLQRPGGQRGPAAATWQALGLVAGDVLAA
ncbi:MAG: methionyl-tRNA formyltransferase [Proteobacteria bacterium]|nr:methionyl-tRNA formyltransferase [Pseudomonadota bacterium]